MLEIYNEVVKDLLNPKSFTKMGLKVRQDKNKGFFCEGLAKKNVETYKEIEAFIDEGQYNTCLWNVILRKLTLNMPFPLLFDIST